MERQTVFTNHALERLIERGGKATKHLRQTDDIRHRRQEALKVLENAEETRSYLNDTRFMTNLWHKHGYDKRFSILLANGLVFVGVLDDDENKRIIVTVMDQKQHYANHIRGVRHH